MSRFLAASLLASVVLMVAATPAFALRDPFDPVISQAELTGAGGETDGTGAASEGETAAAGDTARGDLSGNGSEGLADTGADTEAWLVAAYSLIAIGGGALLVSKVGSQAA